MHFRRSIVSPRFVRITQARFPQRKNANRASVFVQRTIAAPRKMQLGHCALSNTPCEAVTLIYQELSGIRQQRPPIAR